MKWLSSPPRNFPSEEKRLSLGRLLSRDGRSPPASGAHCDARARKSRALGDDFANRADARRSGGVAHSVPRRRGRVARASRGRSDRFRRCPRARLVARAAAMSGALTLGREVQVRARIKSMCARRLAIPLPHAVAIARVASRRAFPGVPESLARASVHHRPPPPDPPSNRAADTTSARSTSPR